MDGREEKLIQNFDLKPPKEWDLGLVGRLILIQTIKN
jgi:hypothetical protein